MGGSHIVLTSEHAAEPAVLTTTIDVPHRNVYKISTILTRGPEYARVELAANGIAVGSPYDCYSAERIAGTVVTFGTARLNAGENYITVKSVRKTHPETDPKIGIDSYQLLHGSPFVQKYLVLGPFPKTDFRTIDTPYPPETDRDRNATYTAVDGNPIRWREATAATDGMLNLRKHISPNANVVGYALTYVHAPQAMDTALLLGSDEAVAVWLNGNEIHRRNLFRPATPDADTVPCRLQTGWNEVLCKVGQNGWQWTLYLRFTDADGVLNYATHPAE